MSIELKIPDVGESIREVQIGRWLKREGDSVRQDENVVELETDKASMELPAPEAGVMGKILKQEGETVGVGDVIGYLEKDGAAKERAQPEENKSADAEATQQDKAAKENAQREKAKPAGEAPQPRDETKQKKKAGDEADKPSADVTTLDETQAEPDEKIPVTPAARRALRDYGLRAADIEAKGPRIHRKDVLRHVEEQRKPAPSRGDSLPLPSGEGRGEGESPKSKAPSTYPRPKGEEIDTATREAADGEVEEEVPMSLIRRRIAERLVEAQRNAALLTTFNEIDMTAVKALRATHGERFREMYGVKLGFMSFFVKAVVEALKLQPELNAEVRGDKIVYRLYHHIGIAIGSKKGLVVPTLRFAERLSFAEIEQAIDDFARRAAENKLAPQELEGGTFTITNGGVFGSLLSTPIVNPPQSGVLGMHAIQDRPVAREGQVVIRPMMYVALTYDHRVVDGREAVTFLRRIKETVEDPSRILLEV